MPTMKVSDTHVEYLEWGRGEETVVLLHSSGSSAVQWRSLAARLSPDYRVLAPDLYGYGNTGAWPGRRAFHLEAEAELVLALLARAPGRVHLVGHSYGGAVALHVAGRHGAKLRSLTLIEPVAFHLLSGRDTAAYAEIADVAEDVLVAVGRGALVEGFGRFVDYWSGPGAWEAVSADKRSALAARLPKVALDFHAALNEPTRLEDFRAMALPTLLLHGTRSPWPTQRICELLAHALPGARVEAIAHAGHMAPLTHGEAVNARIAAHVDAHSRQASGRAVPVASATRPQRAAALGAAG